MRGAGAARHDRAARRKTEPVARGRLYALQPGRGSAGDADRKRLQGHPLYDLKGRCARVGTLRKLLNLVRNGLVGRQSRPGETVPEAGSRKLTILTPGSDGTNCRLGRMKPI